MINIILKMKELCAIYVENIIIKVIIIIAINAQIHFCAKDALMKPKKQCWLNISVNAEQIYFGGEDYLKNVGNAKYLIIVFGFAFIAKNIIV